MAYEINQPAIIVEPWCSQGTEGVDYIVPPQSGGSSIQTQDRGWTPIYQADLPPDGSGLAITRQQTNGVMNLYSQHIFWQSAGGTYTFEQDVSDAVGGYNSGLVLFDAVNKTYVYSVIDNNTNNFITTPTAIGTSWLPVPLKITNAPISGNQPTSTITVEKAGSYTATVIETNKSVANEYVNITTAFGDAGNGVFKPGVSIRSTLAAGGYYSGFIIFGGTSTNGYTGLACQTAAGKSGTDYAYSEHSMDINNYPVTEAGVVAGGSRRTAWKFYNNGVDWMRPKLLSDNVSTLGIEATSAAIFSDLPVSLSYLTSTWDLNAIRLSVNTTMSRITISGSWGGTIANGTNQVSIDLGVGGVAWIPNISRLCRGPVSFPGAIGASQQSGEVTTDGSTSVLYLNYYNANAAYAGHISFSIVI